MAKPDGKGGGGGGGGKKNVITGTPGDDLIQADDSTIFTYTFDGGDGIDTLDLSGVTSGLRVALQEDRWDPSIVQSADLTSEPGGYWAEYALGSPVTGTIRNIENVTGTASDDILEGNSRANELDGGAGHDWLWGGGGDDFLIGGVGMDVLRGNAGDDRLSGGADRDLFVFEFGGGHDVVTDFDPATDVLVFVERDFNDFSIPQPNWTIVMIEGQESLVGSYDGGASSITLLGVTSLDGVETQSINDANGPPATMLSSGASSSDLLLV